MAAYANTVCHLIKRSTSAPWMYAMDQSELCNGVSVDLMDECDCGTDNFLCHDGSGCLALPQVCDQIIDCFDLSHECSCLSLLNCKERFNDLKNIDFAPDSKIGVVVGQVQISKIASRKV